MEGYWVIHETRPGAIHWYDLEDDRILCGIHEGRWDQVRLGSAPSGTWICGTCSRAFKAQGR